MCWCVGLHSVQGGHLACSQSHSRHPGILNWHPWRPFPFCWCRRSEVTAAKVVPVLRRSDIHLVPCFFQRLWSDNSRRSCDKPIGWECQYLWHDRQQPLLQICLHHPLLQQVRSPGEEGQGQEYRWLLHRLPGMLGLFPSFICGRGFVCL